MNNRAAPGLAVLLAGLAALGPFCIDTYLPSFPEIGESLLASPIAVQQTLTAYMLPYAIMALWHGAISDALGRRRVILASLALFGIASLACAFVTGIEQLWLLRATQGLVAGVGAVVGRAIVRDLFDGPQAQRLISHVAMTFAIAPAVAPIIGGWLHTWFGWRSVFVFLGVVAIILWFASSRWLGETLPVEKRQSLHPGYLMRTYWRVLTSPAFIASSLAIGFNFVGFFIYIMSAPVFMLRHLGVSEREFFWLFGPAMAGLVIGSWISGRLAGKASSHATIGQGYALMAGAALTNLLITHVLPPGLPWSVAPIFLYTVGMSLSMPSLTLAGLDLFPAQRGLASSCQTFLQSLCSALVAGIVAPLLWDTPAHLAYGMAGLLGLGGLCAWLHHQLTCNKLTSP